MNPMTYDENDLYVCQSDILESKVRPVQVIGLVVWGGKLIILDAMTAIALEDKIGKEAFDALPFMGAEQLFDYDELSEYLEDY